MQIINDNVICTWWKYNMLLFIILSCACTVSSVKLVNEGYCKGPINVEKSWFPLTVSYGRYGSVEGKSTSDLASKHNTISHAQGSNALLQFNMKCGLNNKESYTMEGFWASLGYGNDPDIVNDSFIARRY